MGEKHKKKKECLPSKRRFDFSVSLSISSLSAFSCTGVPRLIFVPACNLLAEVNSTEVCQCLCSYSEIGLTQVMLLWGGFAVFGWASRRSVFIWPQFYTFCQCAIQKRFIRIVTRWPRIMFMQTKFGSPKWLGCQISIVFVFRRHCHHFAVEAKLVYGCRFATCAP